LRRAEDAAQLAQSPAAPFWLTAPTRAIWVPAGAIHEIFMRGVVDMSTLYAEPEIAAPLAQDCWVLEVRPLLRELVLHVVAIGALTSDNTEHEHLKQVLVDQIAAARSHSTALCFPKDPRAPRRRPDASNRRMGLRSPKALPRNRIAPGI
jgi:hypothetical protein